MVATTGAPVQQHLTTAVIPELSACSPRLRQRLGEQTYESLARTGEANSTVAMMTYAYDQIDKARAELNAVSE